MFYYIVYGMKWNNNCLFTIQFSKGTLQTIESFAKSLCTPYIKIWHNNLWIFDNYFTQKTTGHKCFALYLNKFFEIYYLSIYRKKSTFVCVCVFHTQIYDSLLTRPKHDMQIFRTQRKILATLKIFQSIPFSTACYTFFSFQMHFFFLCCILKRNCTKNVKNYNNIWAVLKHMAFWIYLISNQKL